MSVNQKIASLMRTLSLPSTPNVITQFNNLVGSGGGGGCSDFTLTVEALAFVNPGTAVDGIGIMTSATNQEYLYKEGEKVVSLVLPWVVVPESSLGDYDFVPFLNITTDRSCCQDAIQISLVGENIQDLAEYVPLDFEIPAGESAIMIPLMFSSEASFGPKIIGVQAIGCGQNKIKDLYFEYFNDYPCPDAVAVYATISGPSYLPNTTLVNFQFQNTDIGLLSGDYEIEVFKNGSSLGTRTGFTYSYNSLPFMHSFDFSAYYTLDIKFTPWSFNNSAHLNDCGDYCGSYSGTGGFNTTFNIFPCQPEPYYTDFSDTVNQEVYIQTDGSFQTISQNGVTYEISATLNEGGNTAQFSIMVQEDVFDNFFKDGEVDYDKENALIYIHDNIGNTDYNNLITQIIYDDFIRTYTLVLTLDTIVNHDFTIFYFTGNGGDSDFVNIINLSGNIDNELLKI